jgi:hypothetical protein
MRSGMGKDARHNGFPKTARDHGACVRMQRSALGLSPCVPQSTRHVEPCGAGEADGCARRDVMQYAGLGDWWVQHTRFESLVAAMLDDPFSHVGSVGFDMLERLLTGNNWRPEALPATHGARTGTLNLSFILESPHFAKALPHAVRERIMEGDALRAEEAVCAARLLTDAIAADSKEHERWMEAVIRSAGDATPDAESPFTIQ